MGKDIRMYTLRPLPEYFQLYKLYVRELFTYIEPCVHAGYSMSVNLSRDDALRIPSSIRRNIQTVNNF